MLLFRDRASVRFPHCMQEHKVVSDFGQIRMAVVLLSERPRGAAAYGIGVSHLRESCDVPLISKGADRRRRAGAEEV